MSTGSNFSNY